MMTLTKADAHLFFANESENPALRILAAKKFLSFLIIQKNETTIACFGINDRKNDFCFAALYVFKEISQQMQEEILQLIRTEVPEKFIALKIVNDTFAPKLTWESNIIKDQHCSYIFHKRAITPPPIFLDKKYDFRYADTKIEQTELSDFFKKAFEQEQVAATTDFINDFMAMDIEKQIDTIYFENKIIACLLHCKFVPDIRYIFLLGTHPDFLQKGLATFLLKQLFAATNEERYTLGVYKNAKATKLYEKTGFIFTKRNNYLL